jgi:hypothetical protein
LPRLTLRPVKHRLYGDFVMPSRLDRYRELLELALGADYKVVSIEHFWSLITQDSVDPAARYLILRHDIDTDPATAGEMLAIERSVGATGSYFFRLSTFDLELAEQMSEAGACVGYHYEELATLAKERRVHRVSDAEQLVPEAQDRFRQNLERLRRQSGLPMSVAASHGDFVNRALGLPNWTILKDLEIRRQANVELEAYDAAFMDRVTSRHSDTHHPRYWIPGSPAPAIVAGRPVVYVLVHPRHWRVARSINARDDLRRVAEGLAYRRSGRPARSGQG